MSTIDHPNTEATSAEARVTSDPVLVSDVVRSDRLLLADNTVKNHVIAATGVSLVPVPLLDLAAIMGIQVDLMHELCKLYDVPFKEKLVRSLLTSLAGAAGTVVAMATLTSLAKTVPMLGSVAGAAGLSATAAAVTYATGRVFIQHFEGGGSLSDFDPVQFKELFKAKIKEGAQVVKSFKPKSTTNTDQTAQTV
ncbi:YcjF family protein [Azohydromonas lata]|uniref:DUF697 domain-containing protein n=1 Tax=Azohydromonas lata TaxID=45677 RepID=A0ABU5ICR9_9BURK|nr:DUF697 domain-containing protein [Azohydromonas lata]MDZ5456889.1 DUF697 domain-containing protein [Azohydromonas lata]